VEGAAEALPSPANPTFRRDPNPGQQARAVREELVRAVLERLAAMTPEERRALRIGLAEEDEAAARGAA